MLHRGFGAIGVMSELRFLILAALLSTMSFAGVRWWIDSGGSVPAFDHVFAYSTPDQPAPSSAAASSAATNDDAARDALRTAVLDAAHDMLKDPCDRNNQDRYVQAATAYAEAWLKLAPCVITSTCSDDTSSQLDRAQTAFGTPRDGEVRNAMMYVHQTGEIRGSDFPARTLSIMPNLASDPSLIADLPETKRRVANGEMIAAHFHHVSRCGQR
jgi:hypothetical protein